MPATELFKEIMKSKVDLPAFLSFALRPAAQVQLLPSVPLAFRKGGCFARALAARCGMWAMLVAPLQTSHGKWNSECRRLLAKNVSFPHAVASAELFLSSSVLLVALLRISRRSDEQRRANWVLNPCAKKLWNKWHASRAGPWE